MTRRSVMLIGGPDTGKTNYVARLWHALNSKQGSLAATDIPEDISFVEQAIAHLHQGEFAPRSSLSDEGRRDFVISVASSQGGPETVLVIPDISGELWRNAVMSSELSAEWMEELRRADGALLFVRVLSELNERPLDWVTAGELLADLGEEEGRSGLPTQVMLCELLRFLEVSLARRTDETPPRVAIVVSAWDLIDQELAARGPEEYLSAEYPLFASKLEETTKLETRVFGLSVVGGDIGADASYRNEFLDGNFAQAGWVVVKNAEGVWKRESDVTLPLAWAVGS